MTPTLSATIAAMSKLPYVRCAVISAAITSPLTKKRSILLQTMTTRAG
jgi:hypothetical protein